MVGFSSLIRAFTGLLHRMQGGIKLNQSLENNQIAKNARIGFLTRVAYGSGDVACNLVFGMISTLLVMFYTDYAGISAAACTGGDSLYKLRSVPGGTDSFYKSHHTIESFAGQQIRHKIRVFRHEMRVCKKCPGDNSDIEIV